jgi:hypothetical protein
LDCILDKTIAKSGSDADWKNRRSLHFATPDFLLRPVALASFMRLSLRKAANVDVGEDRVAGNPGTLRSHGKPGQAG